MVVFLTSSPCDEAPDGVNLPFVLREENGFLSNIRSFYKKDTKCVMICADPGAYEFNDQIRQEYWEVFAYHGMVFDEMFMCDGRNEEYFGQMLKESSMVILTGGNVPSQNAFFKKIGLREKLQEFGGVVMGISAGSMNCAEIVYSLPENPGESIDPEYDRFPTGLGLTNINMCPHYQMVKDWVLDGRRLFEEIAFEDSFGRRFQAFVDGSYAVIENGKQVLYGEIYEIKDGAMKKICGDGEKIRWRKNKIEKN